MDLGEMVPTRPVGSHKEKVCRNMPPKRPHVMCHVIVRYGTVSPSLERPFSVGNIRWSSLDAPSAPSLHSGSRRDVGTVLIPLFSITSAWIVLMRASDEPGVALGWLGSHFSFQ